VRDDRGALAVFRRSPASGNAVLLIFRMNERVSFDRESQRGFILI
jgi:hypothetical protein